MLAPLRLAGAALKSVYPGLAVGPRILSKASLQAAAPDIALDVGGNALFAGMTAASLPGRDAASGFEGATLGERLSAGLFDLGTSFPVGLGGRLGGAGISKLVRAPRGGAADMLLTNLGGMGTETAFWGSGLVQNPGVASSVGRLQEAQAAAQRRDQEAYENQIAQQIQDEQNRRNAALMQYGGAGAALSGLGLQMPVLQGFG